MQIMSYFDLLSRIVFDLKDEIVATQTRLSELEIQKSSYASVAAAPKRIQDTVVEENFPRLAPTRSRNRPVKKGPTPSTTSRKVPQPARPPSINATAAVPKKKPPPSYTVVVTSGTTDDSADP